MIEKTSLHKKVNTESGAIVVEATLSLSVFVFTIFTILTIVNIYLIQARMSIALDSAAKQISEYSYLYYKLGVDEVYSEAEEATSESRETADKTIDGVVELVDAFSDGTDAVSTADFDALMDSIDTGTSSVESLVTMYSEALSSDPKGFIVGMGKLAGTQLAEEAKVALAQALAKGFMEQNLISYNGDTADAFLKRYRVVDGVDGLDFNYTSMMYGSSDQIFLVVTYDVEVIQFLNIDFKFTFRQCAQTTAWGEGVSVIDD